MCNRLIASILVLGFMPGLTGCDSGRDFCSGPGSDQCLPLLVMTAPVWVPIVVTKNAMHKTDTPPSLPDHAQDLQSKRKLAEKGDARAQSNLGFIYEMGVGVPQDYAEAVKWYRKAANQGYAPAQSNLGSMYEKGQGVPQNNVQAYVWFSLAAADSNHSPASNYAASYRDEIEKRMTPAQIAEAKKLASEWKPAGAAITAPPLTASAAPTTGVGQPVAPVPSPSGSASSHPRIGPV